MKETVKEENTICAMVTMESAGDYTVEWSNTVSPTVTQEFNN
jgi:hypothetical protein